MITAEPLTGVVATHAEGPVCSPRWPGPRWVDMLAGDVCELVEGGQVRRRHVDHVAAFLRPRRGGGFIVAGEHHLWLSDHDDLSSPLSRGPRLLTDRAVRLNEGAADPAGNLYAGSMAYDKRPGAATLYRVDPELRWQPAVAGLTVSNGLGWSPDHRHAYFVDTAAGAVDVFDWSAAAGLTDRRTLVRVDRPDGLTVDREGGIWVASIGGSAVFRFDPGGRLTQRVHVPVSRVTAVAFVGEDLDTLLITTSRKGAGPDVEPLAGALFTCRPGVTGLPTLEFGG